MISLSKQLSCDLYFHGQLYKVNTAFDTILRVFALYKDDLFTPMQRVEISADILGGKRAEDKSEFVEAALVMLVGKYEDTGEPRLLDFEQDAPYIYAAFWGVYGMDLHQMGGYVGIGPWKRPRLDWRQFIALFQGLPDNTKIKEIISIRRRPVPIATKHNGPEIKALMEAKTFYAIRMSEEEAEISFQRGVDRLAANLISRAKPRKGGEGQCQKMER